MWSDRSNTPTRPKVIVAIVFVSLLAPFLGGCTEPWAVGVLAMLIGGFYLLLPPRNELQPWIYLTALAFVLFPLTAFLPASWFSTPAWRAIAMRDLLIPLPSTVTPQPWMTLESWLMLVLGTTWLLYVTSLLMKSESRWNMARLYVSGAAMLAALAIASSITNLPLPFWHAQQNFGFFPNRNQMGDWLALAALLVPALMYEDWNHNWLLTGWWFIVLGILGTALVMDYSRAGVLILFAGAMLFLVWVSLVRRWTGRLIVGITLLVAMVTLFLIFGGKTLERLQQSTDPTGVEQTSYRLNIHHDTLELKKATSWIGVGLGNFSSVFPFHRDSSRTESRVIHPESDWLWLAAEAGWVAVAIVGVGLLLLLMDAFPMERGTARTVRMAATLGVLAFAAHSLVDVSAHRLGSFIPACLFVLLMGHPRYLAPITPWIRSAVRVYGALVLAVGCYAVYATVSPHLLPGSAGVIRAKQQAGAALARGDRQAAVDVLDHALVWAPLDWELYYRRATARLYTSTDQARMDFLRARTLEPNSSLLPKQEGELWLPIHPIYTVSAWSEALRRDLHNPSELYFEMLSKGANVPVVREGLRSLAQDKPEFLIIFASSATPEEFHQMRLKTLARDPRLDRFTVAQKQQLFRVWSEKEGLQSVVDAVHQVPSWKTAASLYLAQNLAGRGEFQSAYFMLRSMVPTPRYPQIASNDSLETLQRRASQRPDDFATAYLLVRTHLLAADYAEALERTHAIVTHKSCPPYFFYLQAEAAVGLGQWREAWQSLSRYQSTQQ